MSARFGDMKAIVFHYVFNKLVVAGTPETDLCAVGKDVRAAHKFSDMWALEKADGSRDLAYRKPCGMMCSFATAQAGQYNPVAANGHDTSQMCLKLSAFADTLDKKLGPK